MLETHPNIKATFKGSAVSLQDISVEIEKLRSNRTRAADFLIDNVLTFDGQIRWF